MKKILSVLIVPVLLPSIQLHAQDMNEAPAGKIVYNQIIARQKDSLITQTSYTTRPMILYFGKQASVYQQEPRAAAAPQIQFKGRVEDSALVSKARIAAELESKLPGGTLGRKPTGSILFRKYGDAAVKSQQTFNGDNFIIEDTLPAIKWKLVNETKEIGGYACSKATGTFRGRSYEAWYATAIPVPAGPWKLGGLPGLILEATDSENEVKFTLQSVTIPNPDGNVMITASLQGEKITSAQYKEKVMQNIERASNMIRASGGRSSVNIQQLVPMEKDKGSL